MQTRIYVDHAATTALSSAAYAAMQPWLQDKYGNPSTLYSLARDPRKAITSSRKIIAECIGAKPEEIFFTSGGTEADNWALTGVAFRSLERRGKIIASSIEHHAILNTCNFLKRMGYEISLLPVRSDGIVPVDTLEDFLREGTLLVSIMLANNEIGTIQPIRNLAKATHQHGVIFHTDAVQAVGHIPVDVKALDVDMLSASAHKFNGPKGVGFLYIREGLSIEPLLHGGAQEKGMRAGTENVADIVGMAVALEEHMKTLEEDAQYLRRLSSFLLTAIRETGLDYLVNGSDDRIPGSLSLSFCNAEAELLLHRLDLMGTAVAAGAACDSQSTVISHVIREIGVPEAYAPGTIRITLGRENTEEEMCLIATQIKRIIGE